MTRRAAWPALLLAALPTVAALAFATPADAQDRPLTLPTRDVDVTYRLGQLTPTTTPRVIEQRLRWDAAGGWLRVDPPTAGLYVIVNTRTRQMVTVRESDHSALELDGAGPAGSPLPGGTGGDFARRGESSIASLPCTEWETRDLAGAPALVCITEDGVMLRAVTSGRTVMEATSVQYGPLDPSVFQVPAGYKRVQVAPASHK